MSSIIKDPDEVRSLGDLEAKDNDNLNDLEKEIIEDVPEKFKGKSVSDVAKAYSELEKRFGQQGTELGELRKLTDEILKKQLNGTDSDVEDISDDDFYEAPSKAVDKMVNKHPKMKRLDELEMKLAQREFNDKHPDWRSVVSTEEFTNWVTKSPLRTTLYNRGNSYDFSSASELFDMWEERQTLIKSAVEKEKELQKEKRNKDLKSATSESTSTDGSSTKSFDRRELIRMKMYEPDKYESMQDEIYKAYLEGRVK